MSSERSAAYLTGLVRELCALPGESEWVEFKENNIDPREIGEYISALSNAAVLNQRPYGYLVWGIEDGTHRIVGTSFAPTLAKKGSEPLENWLLRLLEPKIHFRFYEVVIEALTVVVLEVERAYRHPVRFQGEGFIRIGSVKKPLKAAEDRERDLWRAFDDTPFDLLTAAERVSPDAVLEMLDFEAYFRLVEQPLPSSRSGILAALADDNLICPCEAGDWTITNLGAILFARRLDQFPRLKRKAMRVIQYRGTSRVETLWEQLGVKGYANGFEGLIDFINRRLPANEEVGRALRRSVPVYPELAIRELVANALLHQDFFVSGAGPMVEIFDDRIEVTNPGVALVDPQRFVDSPPKSRNEAMASLMRRFRICEERGSGIDKVVDQVELFQLPAPLFEVPEGFTRAVLFSPRPLSAMDKADRVRACYLHACLKYVSRGFLTNASLRERFGIEEKNKATVSRFIREAMEAGVIKPFDEDAARKMMKYVPFWA